MPMQQSHGNFRFGNGPEIHPLKWMDQRSYL